jgi:hypothetical protein
VRFGGGVFVLGRTFTRVYGRGGGVGFGRVRVKRMEEEKKIEFGKEKCLKTMIGKAD